MSWKRNMNVACFKAKHLNTLNDISVVKLNQYKRHINSIPNNLNIKRIKSIIRKVLKKLYEHLPQFI